MAAFSIHHRSTFLYTCLQPSTDMPVLHSIICWTSLPSVEAFLLWPKLVWSPDLRPVLSLEGRGTECYWVHGGRSPLEGSRAPEHACLSERVLQPERVLLTGMVEEMRRGQTSTEQKQHNKWRKRKPKHWLYLKHTCSQVCCKCVSIITVQKCNINKYIWAPNTTINIYTSFSEIDHFFKLFLHSCTYSFQEDK